MRQVVSLEQQGRVAILTIDRPEVCNAINFDVATAIAAQAEALGRNPGIGALIVCGSGSKAFSTGADLATVARLNGADKRRFVEACWKALDQLASLPFPTIAAMEGYALGGGLEMALACDLRVADPDTVLGFPEILLGGVASFGAVQRLPGMIGTGRARELLFLGKRMDGREAARIGLVSMLTASGAVRLEALAVASELATRSPEAVRYLKLALSAGFHQGAAGIHGLISDLCHSDPDYQARIARFAQNK